MPFKTPDNHIAFLRGINVGGRNRVSMKHLAAMFEKAGCTRVSTYIQSGNVIFTAKSTLVRRIPELISASLAAELGVEAPVIVRSTSELTSILRNNPFLRRKPAAPEHLHVGFLAKVPSRSQIGALDHDRSPGDAFQVRGREIYLCCPQGVARTKLTVAYFDKVLETTTTLRNWRTVQKLVELSGT